MLEESRGGVGMWERRRTAALEPWVRARAPRRPCRPRGPGRRRQAGVGEGHGTTRLRQCWGRGLTLLLDGVKFMVFLGIRVPTRPDLERPHWHGQCPWFGQARSLWWEVGQGGAKGFRRRCIWGSRALPVATVAQQERGWGGPMTAASFLPEAQAGHGQVCICGASCLSWPYKSFVTRWVL